MSDFDKYTKQGGPGQAEKARIWQTAIGLQDVDGLKTSDYLKETAQRHIEGDISIEDVRDLLDRYYESKTKREQVEERTEEVDKVSAAFRRRLPVCRSASRLQYQQERMGAGRRFGALFRLLHDSPDTGL